MLVVFVPGKDTVLSLRWILLFSVTRVIWERSWERWRTEPPWSLQFTSGSQGNHHPFPHSELNANIHIVHAWYGQMFDIWLLYQYVHSRLAVFKASTSLERLSPDLIANKVILCSCVRPTLLLESCQRRVPRKDSNTTCCHSKTIQGRGREMQPDCVSVLPPCLQLISFTCTFIAFGCCPLSGETYRRALKALLINTSRCWFTRSRILSA